ncbi:MAG: UxaA family hydrolase [Methylobacteriaceae bacterium]|nr:UxaA family hydrolase [Methylobacteriaceae bacterium]
MTAADAISLAANDNVATALRPIAAGESVAVACNGAQFRIRVVDDVPLCHKVALATLAPGQTVFKYGQPIGVATAPIDVGAHVHVHNIRSNRVTS